MDNVFKAIKVLEQGGIVIFPTDTAFGMGCKIDDNEAVSRLFKIRKRPENMATPVLFDSIKRVNEYVLPFDSEVEKLIEKHWPGGLTLILRCNRAKVPLLVRGGGETLGIRIPDHEVPIKLIQGINLPIIGTSANFHGEPTPYSFEALDKSLIKLVDFVIEGKTKGENSVSTVLDCTKTPWIILRQGIVSI